MAAARSGAPWRGMVRGAGLVLAGFLLANLLQYVAQPIWHPSIRQTLHLDGSLQTLPPSPAPAAGTGAGIDAGSGAAAAGGSGEGSREGTGNSGAAAIADALGLNTAQRASSAHETTAGAALVTANATDVTAANSAAAVTAAMSAIQPAETATPSPTPTATPAAAAAAPILERYAATPPFSRVLIFGWYTATWHQNLEFKRAIQTLVPVPVELNDGNWRDEDALRNDTLFILCGFHQVAKLPFHYIIFQTEQWTSHYLTNETQYGISPATGQPSTFYEAFLGAIEVWDYAVYNIQHLAPLFPSLHFAPVPFAWFPAPDDAIVPPEAKDIDVLFFGSLNAESRKQKLLALAAAGINVTVCSNSKLEGVGASLDWIDHEAMDRLIARAKIVVNLHFYGGVLETCRIIQAVSLKTLVVTEPGLDPVVNAEWEDKLVISPFEGMIDLLKHFLANDAERELRVQRAFEYARDTYRLASWIQAGTGLSKLQFVKPGAGSSPASIMVQQ